MSDESLTTELLFHNSSAAPVFCKRRSGVHRNLAQDFLISKDADFYQDAHRKKAAAQLWKWINCVGGETGPARKGGDSSWSNKVDDNINIATCSGHWTEISITQIPDWFIAGSSSQMRKHYKSTTSLQEAQSTWFYSWEEADKPPVFTSVLLYL